MGGKASPPPLKLKIGMANRLNDYIPCPKLFVVYIILKITYLKVQYARINLSKVTLYIYGTKNAKFPKVLMYDKSHSIYLVTYKLTTLP